MGGAAESAQVPWASLRRAVRHDQAEYLSPVPRRTNQFQQVIHMIKDHLATDATVAESVELADSRTGDLREVDVVIESTQAGHDYTLSIECRDHKRRQDVRWVDEMWGKHFDLPTRILVLVSRSGFTEPARILAQKRGIELLDIDTSADTVARIAKRARELKVRTTTLDPHVAVAKVCSLTDGRIEHVHLPPECGIFLADRRVATTGHHLVQLLLGIGMADPSLDTATGIDEVLYIEREPLRVKTPEGYQSLYLAKSSEGGTLWEIMSVRIAAQVLVETQDVIWSHGQAGSTEFGYGEVDVAEDSLLFVTTTEAGTETLSIRTRSGKVIRIGEDPR